MPKKTSPANEFTDTAHRVWLAGLGALAAAGDEGEKLFASLVRRGAQVEKQVERPVSEARTRLREGVEQLRTRAGRTLGSLETVLDDGVASALKRIGVPTRSEIAELSRRVERLTRAVDGGRKNAAGRTTARRRTTRKTS